MQCRIYINCIQFNFNLDFSRDTKKNSFRQSFSARYFYNWIGNCKTVHLLVSNFILLLKTILFLLVLHCYHISTGYQKVQIEAQFVPKLSVRLM